MGRSRVSTTVDETLLDDARTIHAGLNDASLIDKALEALLAVSRSSQIDSAYEAYDKNGIEEQDDWGDLASFREAAASS